MKKIILAIVLLCTTVSVWAQPKGMGKNDPEAKKVLDAVSAKFKKFKTIQAVFNLKIENASNKIIGNKNGSVYMKGNKYRVSVSGQEIFSDGTNIWTYDHDANEVTISQFDVSANSITPQKLFTNFYDKDFLYRLNNDVTVQGKVMKEVELTPIDKTKPFHKVLIHISNNTIQSTKIFEKTGNRYTYSVTSMKTDVPVGDDIFIFNAKDFPGVEIVDLR
ncbi:MAG TPA: outer membrane lipoprotein carrier protein LolA [Ferruginibacter sp.]|nr:outer membrane lipoprotein carrier protein LolA [Ferruginibacter sp.]HRO96535.1 outer membrane lipoprotein carrier protein LolA [Ferruginibacter sp.]HRP49701.1 outer membrane lipoprotein carrier protein LolA [Ferruginibacter sp.]